MFFEKPRQSLKIFLCIFTGYKEACIDEKLWRVLAEKLGALLQKEFDERSEDDRLIIERILIFVRNILEVSVNLRHLYIEYVPLF